MFTYSTNWMGPMLHWYVSNNIPYTETTSYSTFFNKEVTYKNYEQYAGGRIDVYCSDISHPDYDPYGTNLHIPIMRAESWNRFSDWLHTFSSDELLQFEQLHKLSDLQLDIYKDQQ